MRALQIGDAIEVVEQASDDTAVPDVGQSGHAVRVESPGGLLLRYSSHAFAIEGDRVRSVLYFVPAP